MAHKEKMYPVRVEDKNYERIKKIQARNPRLSITQWTNILLEEALEKHDVEVE